MTMQESHSMPEDASPLEEARLESLDDTDGYSARHLRERLRVFSAVFDGREHRRILDVAAGMGSIARRARDGYPAELVCNRVSPTFLRTLQGMAISTTGIDIEGNGEPLPFPEGHFDAVIATVSIEQVVHIDHFVQEIRRILGREGYLYMSACDWAGGPYLRRSQLSGKSFHDPMPGRENGYEFFARVRYFTYGTLLEFVSSLGFTPEAVYVAIPSESARFQATYSDPRLGDLALQYAMKLMYRVLSPRWAAEPLICFRKDAGPTRGRIRKAVLYTS